MGSISREQHDKLCRRLSQHAVANKVRTPTRVPHVKKYLTRTTTPGDAIAQASNFTTQARSKLIRCNELTRDKLYAAQAATKRETHVPPNMNVGGCAGWTDRTARTFSTRE